VHRPRRRRRRAIPRCPRTSFSVRAPRTPESTSGCEPRGGVQRPVGPALCDGRPLGAAHRRLGLREPERASESLADVQLARPSRSIASRRDHPRLRTVTTLRLRWRSIRLRREYFSPLPARRSLRHRLERQVGGLAKKAAHFREKRRVFEKSGALSRKAARVSQKISALSRKAAKSRGNAGRRNISGDVAK
jgi:hypothetical protein